MFEQYDVDIFFAGHVHHYTRNWPLYNNVVSQKSYHNVKDTTYIIHGGAGNIEGHEDIEDSSIPDWYAFGSTDFGYGEVTILNSTALTWRAYAAGTDELLDEITLTRDR